YRGSATGTRWLPARQGTRRSVRHPKGSAPRYRSCRHLPRRGGPAWRVGPARPASTARLLAVFVDELGDEHISRMHITLPGIAPSADHERGVRVVGDAAGFDVPGAAVVGT